MEGVGILVVVVATDEIDLVTSVKNIYNIS